MPGVLTHTGIMLLARARLDELRRVLARRITQPRATDLEHRLHSLAERAYQMLSEPPFPAEIAMPDHLGDQVSKFAVMGAAGPDLPAFSSFFAPGQAWVFDTMHKGNPDYHLERVVAGTTDFPLKLWQRLDTSLGGNAASAAPMTSDQARKAMRAYVLGHLCHVAADAITHPYIAEVSWRRTIERPAKFALEGGEGVLESRVAQHLFLRPTTREGAGWERWIPFPDEVPAAFYGAYADTFKDVYSAEGKREATLGEYQALYPALPVVDAGFIRDGYATYAYGAVGLSYGFGYWSWVAFLLPLGLTVMAILPLLSEALPNSKKLFRKFPWDLPDAERPIFELVTFPLTAAAVPGLIYAIWAAVLNNRDIGTLPVVGIVGNALGVASLVTLLATLGTDLHWAARWFLLFGVPLSFGAYFLVKALRDDNRSSRALALLYSMPLFVMGLIVVLYFVVCLPLLALVSLANDETAIEVQIIITVVLLSLGLGALWFVIARKLRDAIIIEQVDLTLEQKQAKLLTGRLPEEPPQPVRLFDDSTLSLDGAPAAGRTPLTGERFPAGRRKLLKLWTDAGVDLFIRTDRYQLVFSADGTDAPANRVVPTPVAPMTLTEFGAFLAASVPTLHMEPVFAADPNPELPAGATFADHGDDKRTLAEHDAAARTFIKLGSSKDANDVYILFHAPKAEQSVRFGKRGPVPQDWRDDGAVPGPGTVTTLDLHVTGAAGTTFRASFAEGDVIRVADQVRFVTLVNSDTDLIVDSAFNPEITVATRYQRLPAADRDRGTGTIASNGTSVTGANAPFTELFLVGDLIGANGQLRTVTAVRADGLTIDRAFAPDLPAGSPYEVVGAERARAQGYTFVSDPGAPLTGGDALMDRAADLAAMLCMGAVSHLVPSGERTVASLNGKAKVAGGAASTALGKTAQIFRNWNLDRRRENEWRMLVEGGAYSDKGTDPSRYDEALLQPKDPDTGAGLPAGEAFANQLGWIPLMRQWTA